MQASRADAARAVIFKASKMVVARVTPEAVLQSFPDFTEPQDEQFILALRDKVAEHLQAGFDEAWATMFNDNDPKGFTARVRAADEVFAAAAERYSRGELPQDAWKRERDPEAVIAAALLPKLSTHLQNVQDVKAGLEAQADKKTKRLLQAQSENEALEAEIRTVLESIQKASTSMTASELEEMQALLADLVESIGADKLMVY